MASCLDALRRLDACDPAPDAWPRGGDLFSEEISEQTGLSRTGVFDVCKGHDEGGAWALVDRIGGRKVGEERLLSAEQEALVLIADKTPDQLKITYARWGNESRLRSDDVGGRGFAPKGKTPTVVVNHKRHGLSIISSATNKGQMRWKIFDGALNADIKQAIPKRAPARTKLPLVKDTISHLRSVQKQPERVRRYFLHDPVLYAA